MIFHENCLPTDNSHEISYLIFSKIRKDVAKGQGAGRCVFGPVSDQISITKNHGFVIINNRSQHRSFRK